jgi:hypothetical protein
MESAKEFLRLCAFFCQNKNGRNFFMKIEFKNIPQKWKVIYWLYMAAIILLTSYI